MEEVGCQLGSLWMCDISLNCCFEREHCCFLRSRECVQNFELQTDFIYFIPGLDHDLFGAVLGNNKGSAVVVKSIRTEVFEMKIGVRVIGNFNSQYFTFPIACLRDFKRGRK